MGNFVQNNPLRTRADVERVAHLIKISEHKRRQAPQGPRVTPRAFGKDWRYPITQRFRA